MRRRAWLAIPLFLALAAVIDPPVQEELLGNGEWYQVAPQSRRAPLWTLGIVSDTPTERRRRVLAWDRVGGELLAVALGSAVGFVLLRSENRPRSTT